MSTLREVGEFGLIDRLARLIPTAPAVIEGIGDDCAVLRVFDRLMLVSCDLSIEGVHFSREHATAQDIGWKAATSSLSDIAAMGGTPSFCLTALACPPDCAVSFIQGLYYGLSDAAGQSGAVIVGGDTAHSASSGITLDVTVIGEAIENRYVSRRGAQAGDLLGVTGRLGLSAAGLHALESGHDVSREDTRALVRAHHHPTARIPEGQWLASCPDIHAMLDVSDGLIQDAGHLADAARLGIDVDPDLVPIEADLKKYCEEYGIDPLEFALAGGEDYELAFAIDSTDAENCLRGFRREFRTPITIIGVFTEAWRGVRVGGQPPAKTGYEHFK